MRAKQKKSTFFFSAKTYVVGTQRTVSMRRLWAPKAYVKTDMLENILNCTLNFFFNKTFTGNYDLTLMCMCLSASDLISVFAVQVHARIR